MLVQGFFFFFFFRPVCVGYSQGKMGKVCASSSRVEEVFSSQAYIICPK